MQSKEPIDSSYKLGTFQDLVDRLFTNLGGWIEDYKKEDEMRGDVKCEKCSCDLGYGWDAARHERKRRHEKG
ncbi:MAG: hypothetical protein ACXABY_08110 [Candidatus Thorarchaeota archaeon]